jgi:hypothetical protein
METDSFGNKSLIQPMRRLSIHSRGSVSSWAGGAWGGGIFCIFPCSQCVLIKLPKASSRSQGLKLFPKKFPIAPQIYQGYIGEHICFYFATRVQRGASIGECPNFPKKLPIVPYWGGQSIWLLQRKSCDHTHELIIINHTMYLEYGDKLTRSIG